MNKTSTIAIVAASAALAAAVLTIPSSAQAWQSGADRPVCFNSPGDYGIGRLCNFETIAQCQATARGINGACEINPWFAYSDAPPQYPVRRRARAY